MWKTKIIAIACVISLVFTLFPMIAMGNESGADSQPNLDLALSGIAVADCPQRGTFTAIKDGNDATAWTSEPYSSSQHNKHWVYIDFTTPKNFDTLTIKWDSVKFAKDYKIQVSNTARDGDWHDRKVVTDNTNGGTKTHSFDLTTARYVRIYADSNPAEGSSISIYTISVFQKESTPANIEIVAQDVELLTEDFIKTTSTLYPELANESLQKVKATLNLPKTGFASSSITWAVSPDDGGINVETGEVTRGETDKNYTLTASINKGDVTLQKSFDVTVVANKVIASRVVQMEDRTYLESAGKPMLYVTVQNVGVQQLLGHNKAFKDYKPADFTTIFGQVDEMPLDWIENMFEKMSMLGYKHIGIIFKWREWEPSVPGEYDWTIVDKYIELSDKYDMNWDLVYFGSNSCGGTRLSTGHSGSEWWMRDVPDYLDKYEGYFDNGTHPGAATVRSPVLRGENYEYIKANEIRAIQDLMNHIAVKDVNRRTASFQVMNEPDWHSRYNTSDKRWVWDWLSDVAVAIKASDYSLITRVNGGYAMGHNDFLPISEMPGIDMVGDDSYSADVNTIKHYITKDLAGTGFPHIAENDGSYSNTSSLVLTTLLYGGGYHGWQFVDHSVDQGMYDPVASGGPYYTWRLGEPVKWRESGQDMSRLNPAMNKISTKLARAPLNSMVGFNIEQNFPSKNYHELKYLDGLFTGYESDDASVALALKDEDAVYLVSDSAAKNPGKVNFLTYQTPISASYGEFDEKGNWKVTETVTAVQGADSIYRIPVRVGEALRVEYGNDRLPAVTDVTLSKGNLNTEFDTGIHEYSVGVGEDTKEIRFTVGLSDPSSFFMVNGMKYRSGSTSLPVPLQFGENKIEIQVVWNGINVKQNTYTFMVNRTDFSFNGGTYENIALNKQVTSPGYTGGWWHSIGNAVDGNRSNLAQPSSPNPVWTLQVALNGSAVVNRVTLYSDAAVNYPTDFEIQTSVDGNTWIAAAQKTGFTGGNITLDFPPVQAKYVQLKGNAKYPAGGDSGYVVKEFEVYGVMGGQLSGSVTAKAIAESIVQIPVLTAGQTTLVYPTIPKGYQINIATSSRESVIGLDGNITPDSQDRVVMLTLRVENDTDTTDFAISNPLPVKVPAKEDTPQNINLALNKPVTATSGSSNSEVVTNAVDGDVKTRFVAATGGFPQSITVDMGSMMDINQIASTWDAARPASYQVLISADNINWTQVFITTLNQMGRVVNNFDKVSGRYVKLEAISRGPAANVFALVELEIYNRNLISDDYVLKGLQLSAGSINPNFDPEVFSYTAVVGAETSTITITPTQDNANAFVMIDGQMVLSGQESDPITLNQGDNMITVVVQDPVKADSSATYTINIVKKNFSLGQYTNVLLRKPVTTPGYSGGFWGNLSNINDGNLTNYAQPSTASPVDYQFNLNGFFTIDQLEIITGAANIPVDFDVKTSLDGITWSTVLSIKNYDSNKKVYDIKPVQAQYILFDIKSVSGYAAFYEVLAYGTPSNLTAQIVADNIVKLDVTADNTKLAIPTVPSPYTIGVLSSSNEDVIGLDGTITPSDRYETVEIVLQVVGPDNDSGMTNHFTVIVPPQSLNSQNVLDDILSKIPQLEEDQISLDLPTAPAGFEVSYTFSQGDERVLSITGNHMTVNPLRSTVSLIITVKVTKGEDVAHQWKDIIVPARSATAEEILNEFVLVSPQKGDTRLTLPEVPQGYKLEILSSLNQSIINLAGEIKGVEVSTGVNLYLKVTKLGNNTSAFKMFHVLVPGSADYTTLNVVIEQAQRIIPDEYVYSQESLSVFNAALRHARDTSGEASSDQSQIDDAVSRLQAAIKGLEKIAPSIDEVKASAQIAVDNIVATNNTTQDDILNVVKEVITNPSITAAWSGEAGKSFVLTPATFDSAGSVAGTIVLSVNGQTQEVTVNLTITALTETLIQVLSPKAITGLENGTAKTAEALGLPSTVVLVTSEGNMNASVDWDVDSSNYDPSLKTAQTFTVAGTVTLPPGVENPDQVALTTSISVTVNAEATQDQTLVSITPPETITGLANGTVKTAAALGLPSTVELVTDKGKANANVTWNVEASSYDPSVKTAQNFTVNGAVTLPDGVVNPNNVALTTSIQVTVLQASTMPQSTLTGAHQVASGQTFDVTMGLTGVTQSVYQQMYAQDVTLHFDPANVKFDSVTSLNDEFKVIEEKEMVPGHIRIVAASVGVNQGVPAQGDLLKFKFTVKSDTKATDTTVSVGNVVIANGEGNEQEVSGATHALQISTTVDKSLLNAAITSAQTKHDAAVEGNEHGLYAAGAKAQLQTAIDAAKAIANDPNATQQQVDNTKALLEAAVLVFEAKKISADVNGKDGITIGDLAIVAGAYGTQQGQSGWNPKADVNHDGKVDIEDLAIVAKAILQ